MAGAGIIRIGVSGVDPLMGPTGEEPAAAAERLAALDPETARAAVQRLIAEGRAAPVFAAMEPASAARLLADVDRSEAAALLRQLAPDDAADVLAELPPAVRRDLLGRLPPADARELEELLRFAPDTAGGLMTPDVLAVPPDITVGEAGERLRRRAGEVEAVYYAYVVDAAGVLKGVLRMRDLVLSPPSAPVGSAMVPDVTALRPDMSLDEVAEVFRRHKYIALPVVDGIGRLLGLVTADDAMDAMRREYGEDLLRMGGIPGGEESALAPPAFSVRKRLPWMMANVLFDVVAVVGVAVFEGTIAQVAFLAVLMPIISDMGGNLATQAAAVAIRGMATGQSHWSDVGRVFRKEAKVGFVNGLALGAQLGLIAWLWRGNPWLGVVAAVSLWLNSVLATVVGALVPFAARRAGWDPAMMTGAIVTTVTDLTGFFLFLGMATLMMPWLRTTP